MNNQTIVMCVVALVLGMLLFHMLKGVCGCKVVEGQDMIQTNSLWCGAGNNTAEEEEGGDKVEFGNGYGRRACNCIKKAGDLTCAWNECALPAQGGQQARCVDMGERLQARSMDNNPSVISEGVADALNAYNKCQCMGDLNVAGKPVAPFNPYTGNCVPQHDHSNKLRKCSDDITNRIPQWPGVANLCRTRESLQSSAAVFSKNCGDEVQSHRLLPEGSFLPRR